MGFQVTVWAKNMKSNSKSISRFFFEKNSDHVAHFEKNFDHYQNSALHKSVLSQGYDSDVD